MSYEVSVLGGFLLSTLVGVLVPFSMALAWQGGAAMKEAGAILLALALVGACAGTAGGMSRVGAVGSIVPAFLGLLGGLSIYLFGIDRSKGLIASFGAAAIALSLIVSYTLLSRVRNESEEQRELRAICAQAYTNADLLGNATAFDRFLAQMGGPCHHAMGWNFPTGGKD
ncbi:hypothetical protein [uncultured Hydrogenophaga sp.]|jgi:hypothetical protein|uniref:hypothetical protein n=1 Tax=uncultured Hydrogenophaga sp. TaxID=199683 RepID=UPI00258F3A7F|nr:hypothetical protein [uncultured Hydrogenophaga sp.]